MIVHRDTLALEIVPGFRRSDWNVRLCQWNGQIFQIDSVSDDDTFDKLAVELAQLTPRPGFTCGLYGIHRYSLESARQRVDAWLMDHPTATCHTYDDLQPESNAVRFFARPHRITKGIAVEVEPLELWITAFDEAQNLLERRMITGPWGDDELPRELPAEVNQCLAETGIVKDDAVLICVGAGAGRHAYRVADAMQRRVVLIPDYAAYFRMIGMMLQQWTFRVEKRFEPAVPVTLPEMRAAYMQVTDEATDRVIREGFDADDVSIERYLEASLSAIGDRIVMPCPALSDETALLQCLRKRLTKLVHTGEGTHVYMHGISIQLRIDSIWDALPPPGNVVSRTMKQDADAEHPAGDSSVILRDQLIASGSCNGPGLIQDRLMDIAIPVGWRAEYSRAGGVWLHRDASRRA